MNTLVQSRNSLLKTQSTLSLVAVVLLMLAAVPAMADWPPTADHPAKTKYFQLPDDAPTGYDVLAAQPPAGTGAGQPLILADDFPCNTPGPITDIHIWASWLGDATTANIIPDMPITLGFWSDVPATQGNPSHPGIPLWTQTFQPGGAIPGHYKRVPKGWAPQQFWDPDPPAAGVLMGNDNVIWQYNFYPDPTQANGLFVQQGTTAAPTNYWLSVSAGANVVAFGWKTTAFPSGDNAVFGRTDGSGINLVGTWKELFDPLVPTRSLDLAFAVTTTPDQPPPPPPPPGKWVQYPDLFSGSGLDVNATSPNAANGLLTLADDFQCNNAGPITSIQLWASMKGDVTPGGQTFVVSIWSDSMKGSGGFSQPKQQLWSQTYNPGDYASPTVAGTGTEQFYDPINGTLSPENVVWLYTFNVPATHPFCQQGNGTVYWVSVAAISSATSPQQWGWKTTWTNHWQDAGVFGKVDPLGNVLVPWKPLFNPLLPAAPVPVDFAFQINGGPPGAACDPALNGVGDAPPDTSNNGLDVLATTPTTVGDDFLCQISGQISGFRIWGSWLNDLVDTNATFQVSLWADMPAIIGQSPSHPLSMLCSSTFYPPQTPGGALRYQYSLFQSNVQETFYDPNQSGVAGLIGNDTQIWQYDFFPFVPSCFVQDGGPFANARTYWLTVSYVSQTGGNYKFGWKTSTKHWQDAGVFGDTVTWHPLYDPRLPTRPQLDLAKEIWKFPVTGLNKDMVNTTTATADGIQIILSGTHLITWNFQAPPWPNFSVTFDPVGNTILTWSGGGFTVPINGIAHVGFETPGLPPLPIKAASWLSGSTVIGPAVQVNMHVLGDPILVLVNDFYPGSVMVGSSSVEFYTTPPPLDQMILNGQRHPIQTNMLTSPQGFVGPGGAATIPIPLRESPTKAQYALFVINLDNSSGQLGATDFLLVPLDAALPPTIQSIGVSGGNVTIEWMSVYGRSYQLQFKSMLGGASSWGNVGSPVMAVGGDTSMTAPVGGNPSFYRVLLLP